MCRAHGQSDISSAALAGGKIDFVGLARPLLADPDYVEKLRRNQLERIRPCLSCQEACMGRIQKFSSVCCAVNPAVGREVAYAVGRAQERKKVLVVGGGVGRLWEAARVCALRGTMSPSWKPPGNWGKPHPRQDA